MALGSKEVLPGGDPWAAPPKAPPRPMAFTPVCWALALASILLFLATATVSPGLDDTLLLEGRQVQGGEWWRLVSWTLVHGGPLHLFFNLTVLWSVGRGLEQALGPARFLLVSHVGAVGAAAIVLAFDFDARTVGLSGVILTWAGTALPLLTRSSRRELGLWLVQVAVLSLLPGISWAGHLGGFIFGLPFGLALRGGPRRFATAAPFIAFFAAALALIAGTGRLQ